MRDRLRIPKGAAAAPLGPGKVDHHLRFSDGTIRRRDEHRVLSWTTGDAGVSENLFHFDFPDGTLILDQSQKEGQLSKFSIMWQGVRFPVGSGRSYVESLELVKAATSE